VFARCAIARPDAVSPFDAQADMLMAILGAIFALVLLSRLQDRQMAARSGAG